MGVLFEVGGCEIIGEVRGELSLKFYFPLF